MMTHPTATQTASSHPSIDAALAELNLAKTTWARLPLTEKITLVERLRTKMAAVAESWVDAAVKAKGLDADSPLVGEEWSSGPWATLNYLGPLQQTLRSIADGRKQDRVPAGARARDDGQVIVRVFPDSPYDAILLSGFTADLWMQPGVRVSELAETMGVFYDEPEPDGAVAVVLGAGNIASIPPLDVLYKLFAEGQVCLLKLNPVNEYLGPMFEKMFADFIDAGYVRLAYGGAAVGEYLTRHDAVDEIHVTGSATTHDAIVFGTGASGAQRKAADEPEIDKRVTSELGGVSPVIVVPGPWSAADLRYQAEHVATQKMHNAGFNCIASQVMVLAEPWDQHDAFIDEVRTVLAELPGRPAYYPGANDRVQAACHAYPDATQSLGQTSPRTLITGVAATDSEAYAFTHEFFASALATTSLPHADPAKFLDAAVEFCNEQLVGTLGMTLLIHPKTIAELGTRFEDALARLRYGAIGVNVWSGVGFLIAQASWGAFPGHPRADIQSGSGVVHNALLFDRTQKTVVTGPFAPFPRSLAAGQVHTSPKPPWFVTNKTAATTARRLTYFAAAPSVLKLPGIFASALRG